MNSILQKLLLIMLVAFCSLSCTKPFLYLATDGAHGCWEDDVIGIDVRVQWDLLAIVTLTNLSNETQLFPQPMATRSGSWEMLDSAGKPLKSYLPEAYYSWDNLPMIELAPQKSYSEAINLRSAFPQLHEGDYDLRFSIRGDPRDQSTWKSEAQVPDILLKIGSSHRGLSKYFG